MDVILGEQSSLYRGLLVELHARISADALHFCEKKMCCACMQSVRVRMDDPWTMVYGYEAVILAKTYNHKKS